MPKLKTKTTEVTEYLKYKTNLFHRRDERAERKLEITRVVFLISKFDVSMLRTCLASALELINLFLFRNL